MKLTEIQIEQLIKYLKESSVSVSNACYELFDCDEDILTIEQLEKIDAEIFRCECCSWWFDVSENASEDDSEQICNNCI